MSSTQAAATKSAHHQPEPDLFTPYRLGDLDLKSRIAMAPMTRSRALDGNVPDPLAATYYAQRASAGLIVTEGTQVSPQGIGYIRTPGIHTPEQLAGWKHITETVHAAGGTIFAQLWHVGRISHPDFHDGALPVAPSAIAAEGEVFTTNGKTKMVAPRALETSELPGNTEGHQIGGAALDGSCSCPCVVSAVDDESAAVSMLLPWVP